MVVWSASPYWLIPYTKILTVEISLNPAPVKKGHAFSYVRSGGRLKNAYGL